MIEKTQDYLKSVGISQPNKIIFTVSSIALMIDNACKIDILNILESNNDEKILYKKICDYVPKEISSSIKGLLDYQIIPKAIFRFVFGEVLNFDKNDLIQLVESMDVNDNIMDYGLTDNVHINKLVIKLLETCKGDSLLNADCGTGKFVMQSLEVGLSKYIRGYCIKEIDYYIASIRSYLQKDITIDVSMRDFLEQSDLDKFDMIYATYPFGCPTEKEIALPILEKLNIKCCSKARILRSTNIIATLNLLDNLKDNGILISLISEGVLFNNSDKEFRKFMIDNNYLDAIVSLPNGILFPYASGLKTSLLILKKSRNASEPIYMIDATEICETQRRGKIFSEHNIEQIVNKYAGKKEFCVVKEEIRNNDYYLGVDRYKNVRNQLINPISLNQVSKKIFRGYQIKASELDEIVTEDFEKTDYRIVNISDIHAEGFVDKKLTPIIVNDEKKFEKYCLEDGDIIITAKNSTVKTAVYRQYGDTKAILTGNLIAIRLKKGIVLPYYLKTFLDSEDGQAAIKSIQTGTTIISINPNNLKEIQIPLLSIDKQKEFSDIFLININEIIRLLDNYENLKNQLKNIYDKRDKY
mgnify:CR=1 FL=1